MLILTQASAARVLPSARDRYCFPLWLSQSRGRPPPPSALAALLHDKRAPSAPMNLHVCDAACAEHRLLVACLVGEAVWQSRAGRSMLYARSLHCKRSTCQAICDLDKG